MDYCPGHSGYGVDVHGNCIFCGKPRQTPQDSDNIPSRWIVHSEKKPETPNDELRGKVSEHPILRCNKCGRNTLVKISENWYECEACKACGSSPESIVAFETFFVTDVNSSQKLKTESTSKPWTVCKTCVKSSSTACPYENHPAITHDGILSFGDLCDAYAYSVNKDESVPKTEKLPHQQPKEEKPLLTDNNPYYRTTKDPPKKRGGKGSAFILTTLFVGLIIGLVIYNSHHLSQSATLNSTTNTIVSSTIVTSIETSPIHTNTLNLPAVASITSIAVAPISQATLKVGATKQFTATATYSDGSTAIITSAAIWTSSNTNVVTIRSSTFSSGLATAVGAGITNITASLSGITSLSVNLTVTPSVDPTTGVYGNYYLGLVDTTDGILSGDGCYDDTGDFIILINNKNATDPTYAQLVSFLQSNTIDEYSYIATNKALGFYYGTAESHVDLARIQSIIDGTAQPSNPDVCADFAERLHNDAEKAGIKCAYVSMGLSGYTYGHALDAFQTTDRGLVYIDDTNAPGPTRCVKTANIVIGQSYVPISLFPESGWDSTWQSMGTITSLQVIWDGTWNN